MLPRSIRVGLTVQLGFEHLRTMNDLPALNLKSVSRSSSCDSAIELSSDSKSSSGIESPRFNIARPYVVAVEGNIGCGKSTLMNYFQDCETAEAVPEPLDKWLNLKGHNALGKLYEDPKRWSFSFNTYAGLTRCKMHTTVTDKPVVLLERSLYSMRYCFIESSYNSGDLHGLEYQVLDRWFSHLVTNEHLPVDLFVYLRADPKVCYERLRRRARKEEVSVPYSFIEGLHEYHESWLMEEKYPVPAPVLVLDANTNREEMRGLYNQHKSKILFGHT